MLGVLSIEGASSPGTDTAFSVLRDRYDRYLTQIRHSARWVLCDDPTSDDHLELRERYAHAVVGLSLLRDSLPVGIRPPEFPTSKAKRAFAARLVYDTATQGDLTLYASRILYSAGQPDLSALDLAEAVSQHATRIRPAQMALASELLLDRSIDPALRRQARQVLLEFLALDLDTAGPPLSISVECARTILSTYRDSPIRLIWVPEQVPSTLARAARFDSALGRDLASSLTRAEFRLDREITGLAVDASKTSAEVAEVLGGKRWRTLSKEQKRDLTQSLLAHACEFASVANIVAKRRWSSIPIGTREKFLNHIFEHAHRTPASACVLARHLWQSLSTPQREIAINVLLRHIPNNPASLAVAAKDRWTDLSPPQEKLVLRALRRIGPQDEITAIVSLKERWEDLGACRGPTLNFLIRQSAQSGQASVVLLRDLWDKLGSGYRLQVIANACVLSERDPQVAIVACKSRLQEASREQRARLLQTLLRHSKRDAAAASVLVQDLLPHFDPEARKQAAENLFKLSRTSSLAAVAAAECLVGSQYLSQSNYPALVSSLYEFYPSDFRAAVALAGELSFYLTTNHRRKVATALLLQSRFNLQCAEAAELLGDALTEEQRELLSDNLGRHRLSQSDLAQ